MSTAPKPRLLLHVGYHKTATTWMQKHLFQPVHGFQQLATHQEISDRVERPADLVFDPDPMRALIAERMESVAPGNVPVVSSEILSGHPYQGGRDSATLARRLAEIAPDARILFTIRAQDRILPSVYMQYLLRGGTLSPERFFAGIKEPNYFGFDPVHFEYDRLIAFYQNLFGAEDIYVSTQESLRRDMDSAISNLAQFAGADLYNGLTLEARKVQSASYPEYGVPIFRRINYMQAFTRGQFPSVDQARIPGPLYRGVGYMLRRDPVRRIMTGYKPVTDHIATRFAGRFDESNARLARLSRYPLDLDGYTAMIRPLSLSEA